VDISVIIEYGHRIPEVASAIQQNVKHSIESMTGLNVVQVNVHIHDVHFKGMEKAEEPETNVHRVK